MWIYPIFERLIDVCSWYRKG